MKADISMDTLTQFRHLEAQLVSMTALRDELKPGAAAQLEFLEGISAKAAELGLSNTDVALFMDPTLKPGEIMGKQRKAHKPRAMKVYINPKTGDRIETKGGNHKVLKAWKAEHGSDVVEGWRDEA